jgi:2'-hydroxyisoflavone reductase
MRLLVLGGTRFLGRHLVDAARARGHAVTLLHRGRSAPAGLLESWPGIEAVVGDRTDPAALDVVAAHGPFDAVLDTSGYLPRDVALAAARLLPAAACYAFVSSISVYESFAAPGLREDAPRARLSDADAREAVEWTSWEAAPAERKFALYGALKARCEDTLLAAAGAERSLVVRPGLIVGPHDPTGRFTYWPVRLARGGEALAPGRPERVVQFIDARDLAEWMVRAIEAGTRGTIHATGPNAPLPFGALLEACAHAAADAGCEPARLRWVEDAFLAGEKVGAWTELPLWIPAEDASMAGFMQVDCAKARAAGLTHRPVESIVRDTLAWARSLPGDLPALPAGLAPEREAALLARLRAARGAQG